MFDRVEVPTPFAVGTVNCYVAGRTVVDPGPASDESWSVLVAALEDQGLAPEDVEQVVVTHSHPDHFGLANRLSGHDADVIASPETAVIVRDFPGRLSREQAFFTDFLTKCGLSTGDARTATELPEAFLQYAPSVETNLRVEDGDRIEVAGTTVDVIAAEGHAPGERVFAYDADGERRAVVGDQVLPDITPNPMLQPPAEPGGERPRVLPAYNESLASLREKDFDCVLPGHREEIDDPSGRIGEILEAHEERTANVVEILEDGPATPADVVQGLFGDLPATETISGMSEAVGHLDVLEGRSEVERREEGGLFVYELVE